MEPSKRFIGLGSIGLEHFAAPEVLNGFALPHNSEARTVHQHLGWANAGVVRRRHGLRSAPALITANRSPCLGTGIVRSLAKTSVDSQTGPTICSVSARPRLCFTVLTSWYASQSAGRMRSFIPASTTTKDRASDRFRTITRVRRTPALPTITRPGSSTTV